jgi:hypothetical protein
VPTATVETRTVWSVAGILVTAFSVVHWPVLVVLDGLGAKQDWVFSLLTAEANAPEERSCNICSPGAAPVQPDKVICIPVRVTGAVKMKSWYKIDESVDRGQLFVHVMFCPVDGLTYDKVWTVLSGIDVTLMQE